MSAMSAIYQFLEFMAMAIAVFTVVAFAFIAVQCIISLITWTIFKFFERNRK